MATLTATVVTNPDRVSLSLTAWAADGPVAVYRVHADGTRWLVRGAAGGDASVTVSGGVGAVLDDEAPYMQAVTYTAVSGASTIASGSVTISIDTAYLTVPGMPSFRMPVALIAKPSAPRPRPRTVMRPRGRRHAVIIGDTRKGREFEVRLRTYTFAQADLLESVCDQAGVLLLRVPGTRWPWTYVDIGDLVAAPVVPYRATDAGAFGVGAWEEWTLSCIETDPPVGGIYGDPTASWDALNTAGKTWTTLNTAGKTWPDLARGAW